MSTVKLKDNVYWIGVSNPELRVFDIIMETKKGTTYNSYLINDEKVAIIDTVKDGYFDEFLNNIKSIIGDKKVDYIVVQHTELDHSGSIGKLLEVYPEAIVVASKAAITYTQNIINKEFKFNDAVGMGELNLGKTLLKFISTPNLHWPDTIFTYASIQKILFTCDFTGCHYAPKGSILDNAAEDYFEEMKYYFDVIMGPFKKFVLQALTKIETLEFDMVAPSHGPIHTEDISKYFNLYKQWATEEVKEKNVQIFYISAYGNTEKVAKYIAEKINHKGIKAEAHEITSMKIDEAAALIEKSTGFMVGSPTINQDAVKPAWDILSLVSAIINRGKPAAAFGSFGWSGEGVGMLTDRMKSLKLKTLEPGCKFKFVPNEKEYEQIDQFIDDFTNML